MFRPSLEIDINTKNQNPTMKLIRYPHPLQRLREWEAFLEDPFRAFAPLLAPSPSSARASSERLPSVEWFEDEGSYHARIDLPGVKKEHLRLECEEGLLRLVHEVEAEAAGEGRAVRTSRSEFVVRCPEGIRTEGVEARLADGVLHVTLPKTEARRAVSVAIA
jgi:HSP20 family protein